jgi:hypothetical protein
MVLPHARVPALLSPKDITPHTEPPQEVTLLAIAVAELPV